MRRATVNILLDATILLVGLAMVETGLLLRFVLPPGSRGGAGLDLLGWSRHEWGDLHFWLALVLVALVAMHLILHWDWVYGTVAGWIRRLPGKEQRPALRHKRLVGVGSLLVLVLLIGGALWAAQGSVTAGSGDGTRARRGHDIESPTVPDDNRDRGGRQYRGGRP